MNVAIAIVTGLLVAVSMLGIAAGTVHNMRVTRPRPSMQLTFEQQRDKALDRLGWAFARDELSQLDFENAIDQALAAKDPYALANLSRPPMGGLAPVQSTIERGAAVLAQFDRLRQQHEDNFGLDPLRPPPKPIDAAYSARPPFARGCGPMQLTPCACGGSGCSLCMLGGKPWPPTAPAMIATAVEQGLMSSNQARQALDRMQSYHRALHEFKEHDVRESWDRVYGGMGTSGERR